MCTNHRRPKLTIRGIDQIFMIYLRILMTNEYNFAARLVIVQQPTAEFEMNISDRSFVTNATYQTDAQSKISVKIQPPQGENFDCASVW